jgi:drug/metabolite transporter (DMT)-like permease
LVVGGQALGNVLYFEAIKSLTSSTAQITFSSILVFNTVLSVLFLNLSLGLLNFLGVLLLLAAITIVNTGKVELNRRGVILMLIAALCFSAFQLASSELSKQVSAATYLLIAYLGSALIILAIKWRPISHDVLDMKKLKTTLPIVFATALPSTGNFLFAYYAYRGAPEPAKVAMLLTSQVVLTVILSYLFLKERHHLLRKITAAVLVVISAIMIKY